MGGGGYGYAPQGMPPGGGGYSQGGPPGQGGYSSGGRMQGIAGPNVRSLGTVASSAAPKMHLFQKTLRDMITGMRQHKNPSDQQRFLHKCMAEMRDEVRFSCLSGPAARRAASRCRLAARRARRSAFALRPARRVRLASTAAEPAPRRGLQVKSTDLRTKALALEKMAYLHMLGYDMSWAAFHVVEARPDAAQRSTRTNPNSVRPAPLNAAR